MWTNVNDGLPIKKGHYLVYIPTNGIRKRATLSMFNGRVFSVDGVEMWTYSPATSGDIREVKRGKVTHLTAFEDAGFSARVFNSLYWRLDKKMGLGYMKLLKINLMEISKHIDLGEISQYRNIGKNSIQEIKDVFEQAGIKLNG